VTSTRPHPLFDAANAVYAAQLGEIAWHEITVDPSIAAMTAEHTARVRMAIDSLLAREPGRPLRFLEVAPYCHYTAQQVAAEFGAQAHAFDISPDSLRTAARLAREAGVAGEAVGTAGDFHDLPYRDDWFDVVFIASAVHHTWRPERVVAEMLRVLRPGGLLMLDNEPVGGRLCLYRFRSNRAESYTPFERALSDHGALHVVSSPFLGSRPEALFGMVENDRIPLAVWEESVAGHERLGWELTPVVSGFESAVEAGSGSGPAVAHDLLERALAAAAPLLDERAASLGFSLPDAAEVEALLARARELSGWIAAARDPGERQRRRADAFGAALRALVRKAGNGRAAAGDAFRRELPLDRGIRIDLPRDAAVEIGLDRVLLPTIEPAAAEALAAVFPPEDWQLYTEGNGVHVEMNRAAHASIRLPPRAEDGILLLRLYTVPSEAGVYRVRLAAGEAAESFIVAQAESRLARIFVPAAIDRVELALAWPDGTAAELPMHVRASVCRLVPVRWRRAG
jgi:ubiquinone/menaquinone biosynthesis C-methylase UbiE